MPGDPTGGRLRLKAFCPAGKPRSTHAYSGLRLRAPPLYAYCGCFPRPACRMTHSVDRCRIEESEHSGTLFGIDFLGSPSQLRGHGPHGE